jgi:hypothetical protein
MAHIPSLPQLKHIIIIKSTCRTDISLGYVDIPFSSSHLDYTTNVLPSLLLQQIYLAPQLLSIRLSPSDHKISYNADSWDTHDISGILIRTYLGSRGEQLMFLKIRAQERWRIYTILEGDAVSPREVEKAFELSGESMDWMEPGRGLGLDERAWKFLFAAT